MSVYSQWFYEVFDANGRSLDKTLELDAARKRRPCEGWIEAVDRVVIEVSEKRRIVKEVRDRVE
jgi:hypothetical protein